MTPIVYGRSKIFIRFPRTLFETEDALQKRKHEIGKFLMYVPQAVPLSYLYQSFYPIWSSTWSLRPKKKNLWFPSTFSTFPKNILIQSTDSQLAAGRSLFKKGPLSFGGRKMKTRKSNEVLVLIGIDLRPMMTGRVERWSAEWKKRLALPSAAPSVAFTVGRQCRASEVAA